MLLFGKMKNSHILLLYVGLLLSSLLSIAAQGVSDVQTWEQLKKASSTSIMSAAENCQKSIDNAKNNCKSNIEQAAKLISQKMDETSAQTLIQETTEEVAGILQSVSTRVYGQLLEIGNRFQNRLEQIVSGGNPPPPPIVNELKGIFQSAVDETDQIIINAKQLFNSSYNPSVKLQQTVGNEIGKLMQVAEVEFNQLEKTIIETLNRFNKGLAVVKDVQTSLKKSGQLPQNWTPQDLKKILLSCAQVTLTLQSIGKMQEQSNSKFENQPAEEAATQQHAKSKAISATPDKVNDEISALLEEETELDEGESESDGCGHTFEQAKKRLRTKLVTTVKNLKKAKDVKMIDEYTNNALENYGELLRDVSHKINAKVVDFTHQFIKLYSTVLGILEKINVGMRDKLVEILNDQSIDSTDFYFNNIKKYFAETYLTEAKMKELYATTSGSMKTAKTRKVLQKQIIKQLSLKTSDLIRDMDTMKSTTLYILLEMRKGVVALQTLKSKSNISGIRYWFNFYDGKTDCAQLKKLVHIINALNINGLFEQEVISLQSAMDQSKFEGITQIIQKALTDRTSLTLTELEQKTNLREIESARVQFLKTFNSIITAYKTTMKRVMKRVVVKFINLYEETLIIMKRSYVKEVEVLDAILDNETRNIDSDIPLFGIYLAENSEMNVEQDTGIRLGRKFKNVREAKYTMKSNINQMSQTLVGHITEMKTEIQNIMTIISEEAKNLQKLQNDVKTNSKNYVISFDKFSRLQFLMQLANTLSISHGDITNGASNDVNSSNQQLETYFNSAIERLRSEKQNAQLEIEKCTDGKQLHTQIIMATTRIREVISDTAIEMRTDINHYTAQYKTALEAYVKCTNHETILTVLDREKENEEIKISMSQHLQTYLQDKYSANVLQTLLTSSTEGKNIQQNKKLAIETLNLTIKQIETEMVSAKSESMDTIFSTLKQGIDLLEMSYESEKKQRLDEEPIKALCTVSRLLKILHDNMAINAENSIEEARNEINAARESFNNEFTRSVEVLSKLTDKSAIQNEAKTTIDLFESIYNTMRQSVKTKIETLSIEFHENLKMVSAKTTRTETIIQEILTGVYNEEFIKKEEYQQFIAVVNSETYTSSVAVVSMYEKIQRDRKISLANGQSLDVLTNLNAEIMSNVDRIEKIVEFVSYKFEESTNIITSINEGKQLEITDVNDISALTQSLLIYQTVIQIQNRADFANTQRVIHKEYEQAVQMITSANNENTVQETMLRSIEKYDTVSNIIENEVTQKFMKITSDFTSKYEIVMQIVTGEGREELLVVLQNIVEKKMCDTVSERYRKFESYINSSGFRSTTFAKDSYQRLLQQQDLSTGSIRDISLEQLKLLTTEIEEYIQELDIESQFANEHFSKGIRILQGIQNGNFKLTEEQIQIVTECVMISQMIFRHNNLNDVRSKNEEEWEAFSTAKRSVDEEYSHIVETIKSTKEKVIVEQTISTTAYKYDDIHNNLREEMKQVFSNLQMDFTTTYDTITEILQVQNIPMYNKLQKIQNKPTTISIKYTKFESYIKSETFTSYSLIRNEFVKLKHNDKSASTKVGYHIEQLETLTKTVTEQIEKMNQLQIYVTETLQKSTEILQSTETDVNMQLNDEQFITLCEAFRISNVIEGIILTEEQIEEKFSIAERNINDVYENTINEIQVSTNENIQQTITANIQNYTCIYNNLREEVKEIFTQKSTFFISTFSTVTKSISLQNAELCSDLENIKKSRTNIQNISKEYQQFVTYITSSKFSSSSYITHIYQSQNIFVESTNTNMKENYVKQLETFTNEVKQSIVEMNQVRQFVLKYFQEDTEYLRAIENGAISKLSQEQITKLTECINISETVSFTCVTVLSEKETIFETAETTISKEFDKTVNSIREAKQDVEIERIMDTSVQHYGESYNILKKEIKETLTQTSTEYSTYYTKLLQDSKAQKKVDLVQTLESIQITKKVTTVIESFKKCQVYLNSESFQSNFWLEQYYGRNIQQDSTRKVTKENSIKELRTITSEVNCQLTQAKFTSKYIIQLFERSTEIFKLIESDTSDQQLSQEQIQLITESTIIAEQLLCKFSVQSQQQEILFSTTQTDIWTTYKNTVLAIQNTKDTKAIQESLSNSVQTFNSAYTNYRNEIKKVFTQTTTQYVETFETTITILKKVNTNSSLMTTLQNIRSKSKSIQVSEEYTKFESYIKTEKFSSINIVNKSYSKLKEQAESTTKIGDNGLCQFRSLTSEVDALTTELNHIRQFVSETIQKSTNILKIIETNTSIQLTEEQITILTESFLVTETLAVQCNSVRQQDEKIFEIAETRIEEERNNLVNTIRSTKDAEKIQETVTSSVKSCDKIYNQAREEIKQVFIQTTTEFTKTYTTITEIVKTQKNVQLQNILKEVQLKSTNAKVSKEYENFESYLSSEAFTTVLLATHSYQRIAQQQMSSNSLNEESIRHIKTITTDVEHYLEEMSKIQRYVSQTLYKSTTILKKLEQNTNIVELTQEEITILTESILISETVSTELNSESVQKEEIFAAAETSVEQKHENALNTILTASDEETIKQALQESVETYDSTIKSVKEEVQNTFTETTTEFTNIFNEVLSTNSKNQAVKNVLQDIKEHKVEVQISEEYHIFEQIVSSEIFSSSYSMNESYNKIQSEETATDTELSIQDRSINQLEKLTTEVNQYISQTNIVRKYVTRVIQKSTKILKIIEKEENIQLTVEQTSILNESVMISEKLSSQSSVTESISKAETQISKEYEKTVEVLKSVTTEEEAHQTLTTVENHYDTIYSNVCNKVQDNIQQAEKNYSNKVESTLETLEEQSQTRETLQKIIQGETKTIIESDQDFQLFKSCISSNTFKSSSESTEKLSKNVKCKTQKNEVDSTSNVAEQSTKQLAELTEQLNEKMSNVKFVENYVSENCKKSSEILEKVTERKIEEFTQEEIHILTITREITQVIHQQQISVQEVNVEEVTGATAQNIITQENENAVRSIQALESEEEIKKVVDENIQTSSKVYNDLQKNVKSKLTQSTNEFTKTLQTAETSSDILQKVENSKQEIQNDEKIKAFKSYVENKHLSSTNVVEETFTNVSKKYENSQDIKNESIQELEEVNQEVTHKIAEMNEFEKYATENIAKGEEILQSINQNKNIELNEEQISTLTRSMEIIETINKNIEVKEMEKSVEQKSEDNIQTRDTESQHISQQQIQDISKVQEVIKEENTATIDLIKSTEDEEEVKKIAEERIQNLNSTYNNAQQCTKTQITQTAINFVEHYQSTIKQVENTNVCNKLNEVMQDNDNISEEDDELNNFVFSIKDDAFLSDSIAPNSHSEFVKEEENETNVKEKTIHQIDSVSQRVDENLQKMEQTSKFISENLEKSDNILKKLETEEEVQLTQEEVKQIARSVKITKALQEQKLLTSETKSHEKITEKDHTSTNVTEKLDSSTNDQSLTKASKNEKSTAFKKEEQTETAESEKFQIYQSSAGEENSGSKTVKTSDKKCQSTTKIEKEHSENKKIETATVEKELHQTEAEESEEFQTYQSSASEQNFETETDFTAVQHTLEEENNTTINSIKTTQDEEKVDEIMKEHIQTLDNTYKNVKQNKEHEITQNSSDFVSTFQSSLSQVENTQVKNTLNDIINEKVQYSPEKDEEMQKFESHLKSEAFSSSCTATNMYQSVEKEVEHTGDIKEKRIHEIEAMGTKMNENLQTIEETTKFVSENLQKSKDILKKVESHKETELNEEEVNQIARSMKITKVLHESEISSSDTTTHASKSLDMPETDDIIESTTRNTSTHTHTEKKEETKQHSVHKSSSTVREDDKAGVSVKDLEASMNDSNCLSVTPQNTWENKAKVVDKTSMNDLLTQWTVTESEDKRWPSQCRSLSWADEKFVDSTENKVFLDEISQILKISRNLIENTIHMEMKKLKLNRRVREDLSALTVCVDNIYNILQRLSTYLSEELERFSNDLAEQIKASADIANRLKTEPATLDDELVVVAKAFFELQYSKNSDLLNLIDSQYENEICDSTAKSRKVTKEKLEKLQSTTNTILDNIDCLVLTMLDTFVNGKIAIQNQPLEGGAENLMKILKDSQQLYELLDDS